MRSLPRCSRSLVNYLVLRHWVFVRGGSTPTQSGTSASCSERETAGDAAVMKRWVQSLAGNRRAVLVVRWSCHTSNMPQSATAAGTNMPSDMPWRFTTWLAIGYSQARTKKAPGISWFLEKQPPCRDAKGDGVISVAIRGGDQRQDGGKAGAGSMIHDRRWAPEPNHGKQCCDGKRGLNDISVSKPGAQGASQCKGCHRMRVIVLRIGGFHYRGHERPGVLDEERPNFKAKHEAGRDNHAYGRQARGKDGAIVAAGKQAEWNEHP